MAQTDNLKLTLLEGSSVVDYNQINDYARAIDKLGLDYVTASGKRGSWWYRLWKSGRAECGIDDLNIGSVNVYRYQYAWAPFYVSDRIDKWETYPLNFTSRPYANICFNYAEPSASCLIIQTTTSGYQDPPTFVIMNSASVIFSNVRCSIFCCGNASGVR